MLELNNTAKTDVQLWSTFRARILSMFSLQRGATQVRLELGNMDDLLVENHTRKFSVGRQ